VIAVLDPAAIAAGDTCGVLAFVNEALCLAFALRSRFKIIESIVSITYESY
jgi:hypothetical protein